METSSIRRFLDKHGSGVAPLAPGQPRLVAQETTEKVQTRYTSVAEKSGAGHSDFNNNRIHRDGRDLCTKEQEPTPSNHDLQSQP
jgi:hypothetical protein